MTMAYDIARGQMVLLAVNQVWTWDGTDWTLHTPVHSPSPRYGPGVAYDAARGQVVLFGGTGSIDLGDTWTWDGTDWTQRPGGRWQSCPRNQDHRALRYVSTAGAS